MFIEGKTYSRATDIHQEFGGQRQGGISTPVGAPFVFLFTGDSGEQHGYSDGWRDGEVFLYTGEGQTGDMRFVAGNKAVRDHDLNGKELLLFEALGKRKPVRFMGRFACQSWDTFQGPDRNGNSRTCIQFHLVKLAGDVSPDRTDTQEHASQEPISVLRDLAYAAARPMQTAETRNSIESYRRRSAAVRSYVLARAQGKCELTGRDAPFLTKSGQPYLEVHHVRRLSDDGPDDPRYVAAICPTVHREIHFGRHGEELNAELLRRLGEIEPTPEHHLTKKPSLLEDPEKAQMTRTR